MEMSAFDYESRENCQRKRQKVETENRKLTQALSSKTDKPTANPIFCKTPPLILNLKPKGRIQSVFKQTHSCF